MYEKFFLFAIYAHDIFTMQNENNTQRIDFIIKI